MEKQVGGAFFCGVLGHLPVRLKNQIKRTISPEKAPWLVTAWLHTPRAAESIHIQWRRRP